MIDIKQFRELVIRPTLVSIGLHSDAAEELLIGTAVQESRLTYLKQLGTGPALGVYQMEPATHQDIWENYLGYKDKLADKILNFVTSINSVRFFENEPAPDPSELVFNLAYATAMARVHYWRRKEPLPKHDDVAGLAHYWKRHYNTHKGKGTVKEFIDNYFAYVKKQTR